MNDECRCIRIPLESARFLWLGTWCPDHLKLNFKPEIIVHLDKIYKLGAEYLRKVEYVCIVSCMYRYVQINLETTFLDEQSY